MARIDQEITILTTPEKVFAKLLDLEHAPEWLVSLDEVSNVTGHTLGSTFDWNFTMMKRLFKGKTTIVRLVQNTELREESSGDLNSSWDWKLTPVTAGTQVNVTIEYTVPGSFLGAIADKLFIERQNEKDLRESLANLKNALE